MFVYHADSITLKRVELAKFFSKFVSSKQGTDEVVTALFNRIDKLGLSLLEITGAVIAKNIPFYSVDLV